MDRCCRASAYSRSRNSVAEPRGARDPHPPERTRKQWTSSGASPRHTARNNLIQCVYCQWLIHVCATPSQFCCERLDMFCAISFFFCCERHRSFLEPRHGQFQPRRFQVHRHGPRRLRARRTDDSLRYTDLDNQSHQENDTRNDELLQRPEGDDTRNDNDLGVTACALSPEEQRREERRLVEGSWPERFEV